MWFNLAYDVLEDEKHYKIYFYFYNRASFPINSTMKLTIFSNPHPGVISGVAEDYTTIIRDIIPIYGMLQLAIIFKPQKKINHESTSKLNCYFKTCVPFVIEARLALIINSGYFLGPALLDSDQGNTWMMARLQSHTQSQSGKLSFPRQKGKFLLLHFIIQSSP